jgi:hypothetical protein
MRFGTWNVKVLKRSYSLETVASESAKYKLYLVAIQEVRWDKSGSQSAENYVFLCGNGNTNFT